ncbi:MAG TPA: hypothetical protein VLH86_05105 [Patescibacteria group bacterium]|nr:hypothetical protein [Patescibacteria group bacterium]
MKKLIALIATAGMVAVMLFAVPTHKVFADSNDEAAIGAASSAITDLYTFLDDTKDLPTEEFFPKFVDKADVAKQVISRSYADLGQTTEIGERALKLQDVRANLADLKREISDWRDSAANKDPETFDSVSGQFGQTVDAYNASIDAFNAAAPDTGAAGTIFVIGMLGLAVALPIVLLVRNKKLKKKRSTTATEAANASLVISPRKFLLFSLATLNMYSLYWGWQSWEIVAKAENKKYHSTFRSWFLAFTSFDLFKKTKALAEHVGYTNDFNDQGRAAGLLGLFFTLSMVWRISNNVFIIIASIVLECVVMTLLVRPVLEAQAHYATHVKKPLLPLGKDLWPIGLGMFGIVLVLVTLVGEALGAY